MSLWYNGGKHSEREVRHEKQEPQFMGTVRFSAMMVVDWDIGIGWNCWDSFAGWSLIRMGIWTWLNHRWSKWWTQEVDFLVIAWGHKTTMWSWWIYIAKWHPAILFLYQSPKWFFTLPTDRQLRAIPTELGGGCGPLRGRSELRNLRNKGGTQEGFHLFHHVPAEKMGNLW